MKFSESWLCEYVSLDTTTEELIARLTMAGLEVDGTESAAADFSGVVVARVESTKAHPQADKLKVCEVDVGTQENLQVVCGAPNVQPGMKVPLAMVGASLPDLVVKQAELRGVASSGMLCSAAELGLSEDNSGLFELPEGATLGADLRDYLGLEDTIIEVDLTPNRGDCLSLQGLAREAAVLFQTDFTLPDFNAPDDQTDKLIPVRLSAPEACPRYLGRVICDVDVSRPSPVWMQEKLRRSGIRAIDVVVDITNYVLLELGQPMHAFDLKRLQGGINVRYAEQDESLTLLDGNPVDLDSETLVIADDSGVLAIAGIMGGIESGVSEQTTDIFFESAHFNPLIIAGKARQYGLHTESSHRFERGVDPELPARAMDRACQLLVEIAGGQPGTLIVAEERSCLPESRVITLRKARLSQQLSIELPDEQVEAMLNRLGINIVETTAEAWRCQAPSWRFDLAIEADLVEEVARIYGYDRLPVAMPAMAMKVFGVKEAITPLDRIKQLLVDRDYLEAITYSFVDAGLQQKLDPEHSAIPVQNPISSDMGVMRTSLLPGLLLAVKYNLNRQQSRLRLFEAGQRFIGKEELLQKDVIAGVVSGNRHRESWADGKAEVDFFDIKGDVEALLALTGVSGEIEFIADAHPALQKGQSCIVKYKGNTIGYIGKLNPIIEKYLDLPQAVFAFELDLESISVGKTPEFAEITRHPAIKRDIAVLVDREVDYSRLNDTVRQCNADYLVDLKVFDVYEGKHLDNNRKSVALSLTFEHKSRTLSDEEVTSAVDKVLEALQQSCAAELRG